MTEKEYEELGGKFKKIRELERNLEELETQKKGGINHVRVFINERSSYFCLDPESFNIVLNMVEAQTRRKLESLKFEVEKR